MKLISEYTSRAACSVFENYYGKKFSDIIIHWDKIVGKKFYVNSCPIRITRNNGKSLLYKKQKIKDAADSNLITSHVLHVNVFDSVTNMEINFQQALILERIKIYLGYEDIEKILTHLVPIPMKNISQ